MKDFSSDFAKFVKNNFPVAKHAGLLNFYSRLFKKHHLDKRFILIYN